MKNHNATTQNYEGTVFFTQPLWCTFRFYIFIIVALAGIALLVTLLMNEPILLIVTITTFIYLWWQFNAWQMHYLGISQNHLLIKNALKPYYEQVYSWSEIEYLQMEKLIKFPKCLMVVSGHQSKIFHASLLSNAQWQQFILLVKEKIFR